MNVLSKAVEMKHWQSSKTFLQKNTIFKSKIWDGICINSVSILYGIDYMLCEHWEWEGILDKNRKIHNQYCLNYTLRSLKLISKRKCMEFRRILKLLYKATWIIGQY